jgi:thiosulfate/3-mercaptopyruvate sulfurtransferase
MLAALILALASFSGDQQPEKFAHPELLVEVNELTAPAKTSGFRILDTRPRDQYLKGHIPGAVWVDHSAWSKKFGNGQDTVAWTSLIGALGIDKNTPVVVYDDAGFREACRIWWILRYWDMPDVRVLNGGWTAWVAENGKTAKEEPAVKPTEPKLKAHPERMATKTELQEWIKTTKPQIVDARSKGEFNGETTSAKRNGSIPGARNLECFRVTDKESHKFKTPADLAVLFEDHAIELNKPVVTYCQSGGRASVIAFALELMGAKDVRNYYRSWSEWGNADDTEVAKPEN